MVLFGQEHVDRYRATDGGEGHEWQGARTLILTTTGRRSGEPRDTPLIYGVRGEDHVIVASKGGAPDHPAWYKNLDADSNVGVQVQGDRFSAVARVAEGAERDELWALMLQEWPSYADYQTKTDRQIPVVVLERR